MSGGDDQPREPLVGSILDQTALRGVVEILYNLHMPILSMEGLEERTEPEV